MDLIEVGPTDKRVDVGTQPHSLTILMHEQYWYYDENGRLRLSR